MASMVEDGVAEIPPGVLNEVVILEQRSMGGGHLTLELLEQMLASEDLLALPAAGRSPPASASCLLSSTTPRAPGKPGRGPPIGFSSFGFRALELPPTLGQVRELLLGKKAGEAVLATPARTEIPAIGFGRSNTASLATTWQAQIAEEGVRIPTSEALATKIIEHEDQPTPLAVIEDEVEPGSAPHAEAHREIIGDLGRESRDAEAQFNAAVDERRRFGALSGLDQELEGLQQELAKDLAVQPLPSDEPLERELRRLSAGIEEAEEPEQEDTGFWSRWASSCARSSAEEEVARAEGSAQGA